MAAFAGSDDVLRLALEPPTGGEIAIFLGAAAAAAVGGMMVSQIPRLRRWVMVLVIFTPYLLPQQHINFLASNEVKGVSFSFRFTMTDIAMCAMMSSILFSRRLRRVGSVPVRLWPAGLYLFVAFASTVTALRPLFAGFETANIIRGIVIFWFFYQALQTEEDLWFYSKVLLALLGYFVLNATYYYVVHGITSPWGNSQGFLRSKNGAALRLVLYAPLCLTYLMVLKGHARLKRWLVALFLPSMVLLVWTDSRAGQGAFVVAFGFVMFLVWRHFRNVLGKEVKFALIGIVGLSGLIWFAPHIIERMNVGVDDASKVWRRQSNEMAYKAWISHPVTGVGLNNLSYWTREASGGTRQKAFTHNIYLLSRAEMGLQGMFALLLLLLVPVHSAWMTVRTAVSNKIDAIAVGLGAGILGMAAHGYFEPHLKGVEHQYLFWPQVAAITACYALARAKMRYRWAQALQYRRAQGQQRKEPALTTV